MYDFLTLGKIIADEECCICYQKKSMKGGGYENLSKCLTETAATTLQNYAVQKSDNSRLLASVSGLQWQNIVSQELQYHRSCYKAYTRPANDSMLLQDEETKQFVNVVRKRVVKGCEILDVDEIKSIFSTCAPEKKVPDKRTLVSHVTKHSEGSVAVWAPKYGRSFLYNNELEKGEIIHILFKKIHALKSQLKPLPLIDQIQNVGEVIQKEVRI